MRDAKVSVEVKFPQQTSEALRLIARTAGVKPETVIKVALAVQLLRMQGALPESEEPA